MTSTPGSLTLGQAKAALDRGEPEAAAEIAVTVARSCMNAAEAAQALHFAGLVQAQSGKQHVGSARIRKALLLSPERASAWANLAQCSGKGDEILCLAKRGIMGNPGAPLGWALLGVAHHKCAQEKRAARHFPAALDHSRRSLLLRPDYAEALHGFVIEKRWNGLLDDPDGLIERSLQILARVTKVSGHPIMMFGPFAGLRDQLEAAIGSGGVRGPRRDFAKLPGVSEKPLHIGYVGSYLKEHALALALPELFRLHDRTKFRITLYIAPNANGEADCSEAIRDSGIEIVALSGLDSAQQAGRLRQDRVDILSDLDGFLSQDPLGLLQHDPAPIIVNYFGFPGTCGTLHDYIVGDPRLIPEMATSGYGERIVRLPHCYMPFDGGRPVSAVPTRSGAGLPEDAFVFLGFHSQNKVAADAFAAWMRCLREVPDSILWMLDHGDSHRTNLLASALRHGVSQERFVFAPKLKNEDHLARLSLADLYLDNSWFNAHTTGADALWRGLPVVTIAGETFASRVGASLLYAAGLPDLVAHSPDEQAKIAIALAQAPRRLAALRNHLKRAVKTAPLFKMAAYAHALERAYQAMAERARQNLPPAEITIKP
ncbi:hypothetical protein [Nisaea denitrificans]|uniref:O-linked N-acetylglucosamine transferase, SPINDLY family protein n=1 Tax=Nisaea denitrificans TaxID=390877 RepID=UPI000686A17D|nr:hypothetical protein [Nisaea denitrificans]